MRTPTRGMLAFLLLFLFSAIPWTVQAQSNTGSLAGTVTDPSGAVVPGASVSIENPVSQYSRTTATNSAGQYQFSNIPFNPYHVVVSASGFASTARDVDVRSTVPVTAAFSLKVGSASSTVTVEGSQDLLENDPTFHTDLSRDLFQKVPLESQSSTLSSLVTLSTPGVAADSNGLFHGLGDHASNSFSIDGQSITDQQSKVFSNQLPVSSIQSIEVISGAPPAEYGGKTSLVIVATTRSGEGLTKPTGSVYGSYGTFGSASAGGELGYGQQNWGNFLSVDLLNTGRFLDPAEFAVFHDKGNEQNIFDRVDYTFTPHDSVHLDLNYSRSWFQTPNAYDNLNVQNVIAGGTSANPTFGDVGDADQRSKIETFNISPTYTRIIGSNAVFNFGAFARKDQYNYFPSGNPLADLGPPNLQTSSISQIRTLLNTAVHSDLSYTKGINNIKIGAQYGQTFLRESDNLGIVDSTLNSPCTDINGNSLPGYSSPNDCDGVTSFPNGNYLPVLAPYDLTRGGGEYYYQGRADIKELALYIEDQIKTGNWLFNLGIRGDLYNGLAVQRQAEPRVGIAYNVKRTSTVLAVSYARTLETPFNENLVLSSQGCTNAVLAPLLLCTASVTGSPVSATLEPGFRNEFHASVQQAFGKHAVISGEYIWKYTHNAFDFSVLGNTPITFPIDWHNSKIPGFAIRAEIPQTHGFSAYFVTSSVAARFFPPQIAGAGATSGVAPGTALYPFRIDHDEKFNETTHAQYQIPGTRFLRPWVSFNWRFDSGLVAGSVPCYNPVSNDPNTACGDTSTTLNGQPAVDLSGLTADEEFQAGLTCDGIKATPTTPLPTPCLASQYTSNLVSIPAPGTGNNDHNPPRIAHRSLFDASIGEDNLFKGDRYRWSLQLTGINLANNYALYNFLSTFSGTHYVTPRTLSAQVGFHF
ncbi:MAG TPA: TonB-dependent receptor [Acidobacteriaceae bacterium]|nr:TonB-dependent receptor [Acidobacteriaceae bacterium]